MLGRVLLVVVVVMVSCGSCHELFLGDCPTVPAVQDFDMERVRNVDSVLHERITCSEAIGCH